MVEVRCPRCNHPMHWNGRLKIFICDTDGFILGSNDPYVKRLEYEIGLNSQASSGPYRQTLHMGTSGLGRNRTCDLRRVRATS